MEGSLQQYLKQQFDTDLDTCSDWQLYSALQNLVLETIQQKKKEPNQEQGGRRLYYVSAEFLIGRLLGNNLLNLGLYSQAQQLLARHGYSLPELEELEPEPSLGNGGLGRLAACFLDSIATLGLNGEGLGLAYHFGLFRQKFEQNSQHEYPDRWHNEPDWLRRTDETFTVPLGETEVTARLYELDVTGYEAKTTARLRLFDLETSDESLVHDGIDFDKTDLRRNLTLFLYPDDSDEKGRRLRFAQEYFLSSAAAQLIVSDMKCRGFAPQQLDRAAVVQLNDTHPTLMIPELIRLLVQEGLDLDAAIRTVSRTCAYTNHTILAEALEKWPLGYFERLTPWLVPVVEELDRRAKVLCADPKTAIIDRQEVVHMAHIAIHFGCSVNGVAKLHTEILKSSELAPFYELYPERFHNETNGITFRRWLMLCNPALSGFIAELIGDGWKKDAMQLERLTAYLTDDAVLERLHAIKQQNKAALAKEIRERMGIIIDPDSVYDIQIKRLHEYKRQQMNALYAVWKYFEILDGRLPRRPITLLFGAKAAPAYTIAKDIIHLILCLQQLFLQDELVSPYLKIVMVENYNVSWAQKLIPACDISEQISLASKEASGTGNMKLMLNGAVTLGTMDGANVEIHDLVGEQNIYTFGKSSAEVMKLYAENSYCPAKIYDGDPVVEKLVDFIVDKKMIRLGDPVQLGRLYKELVGKDYFMTLLDLREYIDTKEQMLADYENRREWSRKSLVNIARAGYFSADRTIEGYNRDIWKLERK